MTPLKAAYYRGYDQGGGGQQPHVYGRKGVYPGVLCIVVAAGGPTVKYVATYPILCCHLLLGSYLELD